MNSSPSLSSEFHGLVLPSPLEAIGAVTVINCAAPRYCNYTAQDLISLIFPGLVCAQYRLYVEELRPLGFVTWAFLDTGLRMEVEQGRDIAPDQWQSGNNLWFVDFVAPFGHAPRMVRDLRRNVFRDHADPGGALRRRADLSIRKTARWLPRQGKDSASRPVSRVL